MMGHHCAYYADLVEKTGLSKEIDLFAYHLDISVPYTERIQRVVKRASRDSRIEIRSVSRGEREQMMRQVLDVFKDGWIDNWGYIPPTVEEVGHLIQQLRPLLNRGVVTLGEIDGETAGFMIVLPNINEWIADLNGRLWPMGWLRLLWRLRYAQFESVRVPLMGIRKRFHDTHVGAAMAISMIDHCRNNLLAHGVTQCEMSWVLESNAAMNGILGAAGCAPYKRYRIHSKAFH